MFVYLQHLTWNKSNLQNTSK